MRGGRPASWRRAEAGCLVGSRSVVSVHDVDANAPAVGERGDERAQRLRRAAAAPDHATPVIGVHVNLEDLAASLDADDDCTSSG